MLEKLIDILKKRLEGLLRVDKIYGLCEQVTREGEKEEESATFPAEYIGNGEYQPIELESGQSVMYFRLNGLININTTEQEDDLSAGCDIYETRAYPVKLVVCADRKANGSDVTYTDDAIANKLKKALSIREDKVARRELKLESFNVMPTGYTFIRGEVLNQEYRGEVPKVGFEKSLLSIEFTVEVKGLQSCFDLPCGE
jgi:hypothetical protein